MRSQRRAAAAAKKSEVEAGPTGFERSIQDLDKLDLCQVYDKEIRPALLQMTNGSTSKRFALNDAISSVKGGQRIRQWLTPVARIAQDDPRVQERLTGFINDCATKALSSFEALHPLDTRPRKAIEATHKFMSGDLAHEVWLMACRDGLTAWAGWFAPKGFYASAEWAAVDYSSWHYPSVRGTKWAEWAEWASLMLLAYLGHDYHQRNRPDYLDEDNQAEHNWAFARLGLWLQDAPPSPLKLSEPPPAASYIGSDRNCRAEFVADYEMEWPTIAAFPSGIKKIGKVCLERNASIAVPEGVVSVGEISLCDHPVISLPKSLRFVGEIRASYDSEIELPQGIERVEKIWLYCSSCLHLPQSIRHVGLLETGAEESAESEEAEMEFWAQIEKDEMKGQTDHDSYVSWMDRYFIRKRENLTFGDLA